MSLNNTIYDITHTMKPFLPFNLTKLYSALLYSIFCSSLPLSFSLSISLSLILSLSVPGLVDPSSNIMSSCHKVYHQDVHEDIMLHLPLRLFPLTHPICKLTRGPPTKEAIMPLTLPMVEAAPVTVFRTSVGKSSGV